MLATLALPATAVTIDWASVGDINNDADPATGYGAVGHAYKISKHEVTLGQYTEFLNATAASDPYGLYNTGMGTNLNIAGITRAGSSGSYSYSVIGSAARPVTCVSWFDAARMANWMHNGQGSGSTEMGVYNLGGATSGIFAKQAAAQVWIPSEDEWYKAAYYSGSADTYYLYPTQSNAVPGNELDGSPNQANYRAGDFATTPGNNTYSSAQNYLTDEGAFTGSASHYGTFDQGGSVWEWNDAVISGSLRGARGGGWGGNEFNLRSSYRNGLTPGVEDGAIGFRLAAVPEPSAGLLALVAVGLGLMRRRRPTL